LSMKCDGRIRKMPVDTRRGSLSKREPRLQFETAVIGSLGKSCKACPARGLIRAPEQRRCDVAMRGKTIIAPIDERKYYEHLQAREELMFDVLKVMADNRIDAIVYKSIELQPQLLSSGREAPNPGVPTMSTFLAFVPTITVPAGFTSDGLPTGITFQGHTATAH
jgi:Asp-tRNA(Asn)/Glu-tRNA(Gln) amidotransferase A subunit family amidase